MLSKKDVNYIISNLNSFIKDINSLSFSKFYLNNLVLDIVPKKYNILAIDSGFIYDILPQFSYVFSRAAGISNNKKHLDRDCEYFLTHFIYSTSESQKKTFDLNFISELLGKRLEYKIAVENIDDVDLILIDGSLYADILNFLDSDYKFDDERVQNRYEDLKYYLKKIIKNKTKVLSISKRTIQAKFLYRSFKDLELKKITDNILLNKHYEKKPFITDIYSFEENGRIFSFVYYRKKYNGPIYRIESLNEDPDVLKEHIISIYKNNYDKFIDLAHFRCTIRRQYKRYINLLLLKKLEKNYI